MKPSSILFTALCVMTVVMQAVFFYGYRKEYLSLQTKGFKAHELTIPKRNFTTLVTHGLLYNLHTDSTNFSGIQSKNYDDDFGKHFKIKAQGDTLIITELKYSGIPFDLYLPDVKQVITNNSEMDYYGKDTENLTIKSELGYINLRKGNVQNLTLELSREVKCTLYKGFSTDLLFAKQMVTQAEVIVNQTNVKNYKYGVISDDALVTIKLNPNLLKKMAK